MTTSRDFKRVVRARSEKTGESYTTARAALLKKPIRRMASAKVQEDAPPAASTAVATVAPPHPPSQPDPKDFARIAGMSDEAVKEKTGCNWERWVWALDSVHADRWPHAEIARYVGEKYGVPSWFRQMIAVGYERVRGLREKGQQRSGTYTVTKSRTMSVGATTLYRAWREPRMRSQWMLGTSAALRSSTAGKVVRFTWEDGSSVEARFTSKGRGKSAVAVEHVRVASKEEAERLKEWWGERLDALTVLLAAPPARKRSPRIRRELISV